MKKTIIFIFLLISTYFGVKYFLESIEKPVEEVVVVVVTPEPVEPEETEEEEFIPLPFTGKKLRAFAKKYGGTIVVVGGIGKAVKVGEDYYYEKEGILYVRHNGETIKL